MSIVYIADREGRANGAPDVRREAKHVLIALAVMLLMVAIVFAFNVPNPNMLLITGLAVFTSLYGYPAGIACGLVMIVYSMYFFSTDHSFFTYTQINLQKIGVIALGVVLNTAFIGNLKHRQSEATRKLREMNCELQQDNRTLETASMTDDLTGLRNRFALRRDYARFENRDVHVMMLDLDDFKGLNDRFGHSVGDHILRRLSAVLAETFGNEWSYRYGGDEFLVVLPDVTEGEFLGKLEAFKHGVRYIDMEEQRLPVHFSAGYVHGVCEFSYDLRLMMHQADSNLYDAKGLGKDCYVGRAFSRVFAESLPEEADGFGKGKEKE